MLGKSYNSVSYLAAALKTFRARRRVGSSAFFVILHPARNKVLFYASHRKKRPAALVNGLKYSLKSCFQNLHKKCKLLPGLNRGLLELSNAKPNI